MAGPGGGPPRRSHTKSRKGCDSCKRRHIRCDETFPQCLNCTKHKVRCPYNEMPVDRSGSPDKTGIVWSDDIIRIADNWVGTGIWPFRMFTPVTVPDPSHYRPDDVRLLCQLAMTVDAIAGAGHMDHTAWTTYMPDMIAYAAVCPYVMHAVLAFAAFYMSTIRDTPALRNLLNSHRSKALNGFQDAMSKFHEQNFDCILATAMLLSWQSSDWPDWYGHIRGLQYIVETMRQTQFSSRFQSFIDSQQLSLMIPNDPRPDTRPSQPRKDDLDALQRTIQHLQLLENYLKNSNTDYKDVQNLINFIKTARKSGSPGIAAPAQYDKLAPLRAWLFWQPVRYLVQPVSDAADRHIRFVIIAHLYAVVLVMDRLFPDIGAGQFGFLAVKPLMEITQILFHASSTAHPESPEAQMVNMFAGMVREPFNTCIEFQRRHRFQYIPSTLPMPMAVATTTPHPSVAQQPPPQPQPQSQQQQSMVDMYGQPAMSFYSMPEAMASSETFFSTAGPSAGPSVPSPIMTYYDNQSTSSLQIVSPGLPPAGFLPVPSPGMPHANSPYSTASSPSTNAYDIGDLSYMAGGCFVRGVPVYRGLEYYWRLRYGHCPRVRSPFHGDADDSSPLLNSEAITSLSTFQIPRFDDFLFSPIFPTALDQPFVLPFGPTPGSFSRPDTSHRTPQFQSPGPPVSQSNATISNKLLHRHATSPFHDSTTPFTKPNPAKRKKKDPN